MECPHPSQLIGSGALASVAVWIMEASMVMICRRSGRHEWTLSIEMVS